MRKALIVGIDYYETGKHLTGCVADAREVERVLRYHHDATSNFDCNLLLGVRHQPLDRHEFRRQVNAFFRDRADVGLFYFAGHGMVEPAGGYLEASNGTESSDGLPLNDLLTWVNNSPITEKLVVLDCCHSGVMAELPLNGCNLAQLAEGVTVLTASTASQPAGEQNGSGLFTRLMVEALEGAAASLTGEVTPSSVYAFIDQSLSLHQQRPVFKSNVQKFVSLRTCKPPIPVADLRRMTEFFADRTQEYRLDPSYEPDPSRHIRKVGDPDPNPKNTAIFKILQQYNRLYLVVPVGADHMYNAAMESKSCKLTPLGQHYWRLVKDRRV
jgi:hypothetical protein